MTTKTIQVKFSYLDRQFEDIEPYLNDIRTLVLSGDFTLGRAVQEFETRFAKLCEMPFAVGVGSGTDAIALALRAQGIGPGDEVITPSMTFIATVGAIVMTGAKPVFVDSENGFVIDTQRIEAAITPKTKAIVPVHYTGNVPDMPRIKALAEKQGLLVVEDACQSMAARLNDQPVGTWGSAACFSLHPLKNLNVWGDAGVIVTRSKKLADELRLWRNHGLKNRDEVALFGWNSRLDTLQAVIGNRLIDQTDFITRQRIENAKRYDEGLSAIPQIRVPARRPGVKHVYHLYIVRAERRNELLTYLNQNDVEAKVHYPIPVHLQEAAKSLGYKKGDFPICEEDCRNMITLPAHQHLTPDEIDYAIDQVRSFYKK